MVEGTKSSRHPADTQRTPSGHRALLDCIASRWRTKKRTSHGRIEWLQKLKRCVHWRWIAVQQHSTEHRTVEHEYRTGFHQLRIYLTHPSCRAAPIRPARPVRPLHFVVTADEFLTCPSLPTAVGQTGGLMKHGNGQYRLCDVTPLPPT